MIMEDWRVVQLFLSAQKTGVYEVAVDATNTLVKCTCPAYESRSNCKHKRFVMQRMEENGGHYNVQVPDSVPDDVITKAVETNESFREFIIKYGKIEVL